MNLSYAFSAGREQAWPYNLAAAAHPIPVITYPGLVSPNHPIAAGTCAS
jgi:hypothetical protein